ncbi:diphthine--ammonia ligase [Ilyomonas limi]|uniref:Diphthine--ammonia ligase n=1 Tax=Ilyomonas limi TaxID=2575867 RepID=A0A4U3L2X4_9BACT|nr:diphthine--ammonia ligase [Ilyomonas limi]TKK69232.1 diphthine--ammonia ligase [Ilyomonas limi]
MHKAYFNWSGGKDSALALYYALQNNIHVQKLLTNVNAVHNRISMHGVRRSLLEAQAKAIGLPLDTIELPEQPSMKDYEQAVVQKLTALKEEGFNSAVFGDIFLEDLKQYRENQLASIGFKAIFPLWKRNTTELIHTFIDLGFKTIVVCTNAEILDESFAGRVIDRDFLKDIPAHVDPCGENGEFHTFVYDGPIFQQPVEFTTGEKVFREYIAPKDNRDQCFSKQPQTSNMGFWFWDLLPA